jgi:hypothetical protein
MLCPTFNSRFVPDSDLHGDCRRVVQLPEAHSAFGRFPA